MEARARRVGQGRGLRRVGWASWHRSNDLARIRQAHWQMPPPRSRLVSGKGSIFLWSMSPCLCVCGRGVGGVAEGFEAPWRCLRVHISECITSPALTTAMSKDPPPLAEELSAQVRAP